MCAQIIRFLCVQMIFLPTKTLSQLSYQVFSGNHTKTSSLQHEDNPKHALVNPTCISLLFASGQQKLSWWLKLYGMKCDCTMLWYPHQISIFFDINIFCLVATRSVHVRYKVAINCRYAKKTGRVKFWKLSVAYVSQKEKAAWCGFCIDCKFVIRTVTNNANSF